MVEATRTDERPASREQRSPAAADVAQASATQATPRPHDLMASDARPGSRLAVQRALVTRIGNSPRLAAQRESIESLYGPAAKQDIPESQEEDIEVPGPALEQADEAAGAQDAEVPEAESETLEDEELESGVEPIQQVKVTQLAKYRRSNRVATYLQERARAQRGGRRGRHWQIARFVPGARPRPHLQSIAALGHANGLVCPLGSYVQRRNNFPYTGSRAGDAAALGGTPPGHVWHHCHDFHSTGPDAGHGTMMLLRIADHLPGHWGGVWQWNNTAVNTAAYG